MIRIHCLFYQLFFVSFMSSIVQFTSIVSISICPCIKINADAVGLHVTQVFTEPRNCYFYGANCVVYEAFPLKYPLRSKLQITTLVRDADTFEMEIKIHQTEITESLVGDISLSVVLDLNFFLRLFYFYLAESVTRKGIYKPSAMFRVLS